MDPVLERCLLIFDPSMYGGFLMVAIGVLYLIFEKKLLAKSRLAGDSTEVADNSLSRSLIGAQVSRCGSERSGTDGQANTR